MRHATYEIRHPIRSGFTLVELLVALAITAMLLAAVAVAFNASVINYRENEEIYRAINGARQALFRITSQLRTATAVDPNSATNECTMITADGKDLTYRYDGTAKTLYLVTNGDTTDPDYRLCENVKAATFTKDIVVEGAVTKVRSVQIALTVTAGGTEEKLSAAAVIRRNLD
ncbi:MAG: prepilin-type N-terminal cleavage/methylation domain-containing protein [Sedimentisphaerales bacterium]|nr:prepilin-type N-terminal cleavage/methylation domain-containing protein [Sedimentisphaerales bacterium]